MKQAIKNAMLAGSSSFSFKQQIPTQYADRQKRYMNYETRKFTEQMARYSSDYVEAMIQGLNPSEPFEYTKVHIRFSDIPRPNSPNRLLSQACHVRSPFGAAHPTDGSRSLSSTKRMASFRALSHLMPYVTTLPQMRLWK